jgi:hypothetical protein
VLSDGLEIAVQLFTVFAFLAWAGERLTEYSLKLFSFLDKKKVGGMDVAMLIALAWCLFFAYGADLDFFVIFHIGFRWKFCGQAVSAIIMAGGSELAHSFIQRAAASKLLNVELVKNLVTAFEKIAKLEPTEVVKTPAV